MSTEMDQPRQQQQQQPKQQQIEWRRGRVLELSSQGMTEREIATILKVGKTTVDRDLAYLNKQAQDSLKTHIQQRLPEQWFLLKQVLENKKKMRGRVVRSYFTVINSLLQFQSSMDVLCIHNHIFLVFQRSQ